MFLFLVYCSIDKSEGDGVSSQERFLRFGPRFLHLGLAELVRYVIIPHLLNAPTNTQPLWILHFIFMIDLCGALNMSKIKGNESSSDLLQITSKLHFNCTLNRRVYQMEIMSLFSRCCMAIKQYKSKKRPQNKNISNTTPSKSSLQMSDCKISYWIYRLITSVCSIWNM